MILRKPYAFLIKNFRLLHAIITGLMIYTLVKTFNLLSFFSNYIVSASSLIGQDLVKSNFNFLMFLCPILIIIVSIILVWVMRLKKKPFTLYITNILIYVFTFVAFELSKSLIGELEISLVDIRYIKAIRDAITISSLLQIYPLIKDFIRAVGFDIKKFDFKKDLDELEISEKDSEEFEVDVSVDISKVKRFFNSRTRKIKYIYKENKFLVNIVIAIIVVIIAIASTIHVLKVGQTASFNSTFKAGTFSIKVTDVYSTRTDYNKNVLPGLNDDDSILIVRMNIKSSVIKGRQINNDNIIVQIGEHKFYPKKDYKDGIVDVGNTYMGELITDEAKNIVLAYEIPTAYLSKIITLKAIKSLDYKGKEIIPTYVNVKLNSKLINLDEMKTEKTLNMNEEISLSDSLLGDTKINITNLEVNRKFKIDYSIEQNKNSYEYLLAPLNTNYDMSLLRISGAITYDEGIDSKYFSKLSNIIYYFGMIKYELNGETKYIDTSVTPAKPQMIKNDNVVYIPINSEVLQASSISLILNVRNVKYEYKIK